DSEANKFNKRETDTEEEPGDENNFGTESCDDEDVSEPDSVTRPQKNNLTVGHPALSLPPVDIMILIDCSSSIGISSFQKESICNFLKDVDIAPGRSRVAVVIFANEPIVYFGFDKYYSYKSIARKIRNISYIGGPTFLAKALLFASGILYQEQNMKNGKRRKHKFMPTPRHDRLQVLVVVSDGYSEDNYEKVSYILYEKLNVKTASVVMRTYNKDKLLPITRFKGAIFLMNEIEGLSMWLWRQQRIWNENYADYIEKEKLYMAESGKHEP
ncbi:unnamed protein product, partial [Enterobius vermicularis]|uniref:VWFA domain-containing protein n=1 Tax=Enterobius vermicularis TaxID=51028 RepID=A0A0N4VIH0_ENTVE